MYSLYRSYTLPTVRVKRDMIGREIDSKRDAWNERLIYIKKLIVSRQPIFVNLNLNLIL